MGRMHPGVLATGSYNWSSGMEGIPNMGNTSTPFSSPYVESFVRLLEEDDTMQTMPKTTHSEYNSSAQPIQYKDREEVSRIISALKKRDDRGPTMKDCREILMKLLHFEDPLYFVASDALCKRREF
ncbi:hypothetical protein EZV62_019087 [Acer yangbiense]|uniref:Uncharacterized protein n=1 Tax=Acer yangbiense TaxID=1000413 RepID=A0A5C7HAA1_9ROSI|nr:hypothetical protein EZV62_019087 [Acer yangbiense]